MCIAVKSLLKFVISTINVVLGIGFLIVALLGLLLKTSQGFVRSILNKAFSFGAQIDNEDAEYLTNFVLDNATGVSVILIVVGLALAALCFVGAFASCCGCGLLLKIYAIILAVLLVAQIVAVAVLFSDPVKLTQSIITAMNELLKTFGKTNEVGQASTAIWTLAMTYNGTCCGMDGAEDFKTISQLNDAPAPCCKHPDPNTKTGCSIDEAIKKGVPGCRERIQSFTYDNLKMIMYVAIAAIVIQASLFSSPL
ncbi:unnamed protein product [Dibothriocephalus latus]|uniref:Tetraspanin n=1 Tax=Dibothriocephalus latus TaxID=60516 RepID=A0A3P7P1L1_DIBLA|nr:unnamed protein product [Dibothriocephalus latus]